MAARNEDGMLRLHGRFEKLRETNGLQGGKDLVVKFDLLPCNPLCNVRRQNDLQCSDRDAFNANDREAFRDFVENFQIHENHGHIFGSAVQFASA